MKLFLRISMIVMCAMVVGGCTKFCSRKPSQPPNPRTQRRGEPQANQPVKTPNYAGITVTHVVKREEKVGKGHKIKANSRVSLRYTEWVYDPAALGNKGPMIYETGDQSRLVKLGEGKLIKGFESGLIGMQRGGKRNIIIPANEAYGEAGQPPKIPPKAMVMIDVQVMDVR